MTTLTSERLLILGLDGATWTVLDAMRDRGVMPNLSALIERAAHGTLRSCVPPMTAAAWTTFQTGCNPVRHGIFDHRYVDTAADRMKVNHAGRIRVPTLWQLLSQEGRSVVSLNLPGTYPPPAVRGVVVSGMDAPHLEGALSGDPAFAERLRAEAPRYNLRYHWKRCPQSLEELRENARRTVEGFAGRADGAFCADRYVPDWSALMVQFQNLDPFQHRCWRYLNVDETGIEDRPWNAVAESVLSGLDEAVGRLLELAEHREADVLVLSDHGFGPCRGRIHVQRVLREAGIVRVPGLPGRLRRRLTQGRDRLRLWNAKRDDPAARAASFELSIRAQFPLDWRRTRAFAPHQDTAAMVYLNRANPDLDSPRRLDEARNETALALAEARHPETGEPLFPEVVCLATAYDIDPAAEGYPDLLALPAEDLWVRTKLTPGTAWVEADPNLSGTHRPEGVVILSGPGIEPGRSLRAHLHDVAPTILARLGLPIPNYMEGKPFPCLDSPTPAPRVDAAQLAYAGPHRPSFDFTAEEQALIEQRLVDLGYME